jgi:hypothetical protein
LPGYPGAGIGAHYGDTSIAEDVTDIIYQITPEDTPFFNSTGDTQSRGVVHEWQVRDISTRNANAHGEGFTYSFTTAMELPSRVTNLTQIMEKDVRVSETEIAVNHYAIGNLFADQMQIRMVEYKTDHERALLQGTLATGSATDAARSFQGFVAAIGSNASTYTNGIGTATMTETLFNDAIQQAWDIGGEPQDCFVGGRAKRFISSFTDNLTRFIPADQQRQVNTISLYESDFFPVRVHLSRDVLNQNILSTYTGHQFIFADLTMIKKAWLRRPSSSRVPKTADSADGVIVCESTLEWGNASAHVVWDRHYGP